MSQVNDSSVMYEMSSGGALDIKREQHQQINNNRSMVVEKGAIGAAGGNMGNNAADDNDQNGGMLFETPPNDGQLSTTPRALRKTFTRSMSK